MTSSAGNILYMVAVNLSQDSEFGSVSLPDFAGKVEELADRGASIIDIGAVSTRPGAAPVSVEEEWRRLEPALSAISRNINNHKPKESGTSLPAPASGLNFPALSLDTTSSEIVRRAYSLVGPIIVNDISAGLDDPAMLDTVRELGLRYVAMHKRGTPQTMDGLCDYSGWATPEYPSGVVPAILQFFDDFAAHACGIDWILDPGLGFAKTIEQNWEILENLSAFSKFGRHILCSCSDKRFVRARPDLDADALAIRNGATILRVHRLP